MADLADYAQSLADAIGAAIPAWVEACVARAYRVWSGEAPPPALRAAAAAAGRRAQIEVGASARALLEADIDAQRTTPLAVLRHAVAYPTAVLAAAGVPPAPRDGYATSTFPEDAYDLTPASWADVDPTLVDPGLAWGAAKAWAHKQRHGVPS